LRRLGLYNRLKGSYLYDLYVYLSDRRLIDERDEQVRFYRSLLHGMKPGDLVFDIGANQGVKTDIFLRIGAQVVAADPDVANETVLKEKFLSFRLRPKPVVIIPKAVSDSESVATMWVDTPGSTMNTLSPKWVHTLRRDDERFGSPLQFADTREIATTTLDRLIEIHGLPYFIKIDVEGLEPEVLRGIHRPVPFLSFEVNLPEFRPEGQECVALLSRISREGVFNYSADNARALTLPEWLSADRFTHVLESCVDRSIDVFWKTPVPGHRWSGASGSDGAGIA
jgi:FkbM family methyltransferase